MLAPDGDGTCHFETAANTLRLSTQKYFRPTEVETLLGDATKARTKLGWIPKISFKELVSEMMAADLAEAERDALVARHGYPTPSPHE